MPTSTICLLLLVKNLVTVILVTSLRWWLYDGDRFRMLVAETLCWRPFCYVGDVLNVLNRLPTSQACHQHIRSPPSVTYIDVTNFFLLINFDIVGHFLAVVGHFNHRLIFDKYFHFSLSAVKKWYKTNVRSISTSTRYQSLLQKSRRNESKNGNELILVKSKLPHNLIPIWNQIKIHWNYIEEFFVSSISLTIYVSTYHHTVL